MRNKKETPLRLRCDPKGGEKKKEKGDRNAKRFAMAIHTKNYYACCA
jgi:hypothetical protein